MICGMRFWGTASRPTVWVRPIVGLILIIAGALILGPSDRPGAEASRWIGIIALALGAISAIFVMPYYPVWSLIYIAIAIMVIYGLSAHYGEQATAAESDSAQA